MYPTGALNAGYVDWKYLNNTRVAPATGLANATVTFTMPATGGTYEIRLLANIETSAEKLLLLILAGQPEFAERLNDPGLRQLKQRVALRCEIAPFELPETGALRLWLNVWLRPADVSQSKRG